MNIWWIWKFKIFLSSFQKVIFHDHLIIGWEVMPIWSSNHTLSSFDHISLTTHEKLMILDFLEMGEKDIQLSCWPKIHLKPLWCWKVKLNVDQKLAIFGNLKLQVTFHFWKLLIWLQNLQDRCLSWWINLFWTWMKCLKPFLHLLALSWLAVDFYGPQMTWTCTDELGPLPLGKFPTKWNPSSYKLL